MNIPTKIRTLYFYNDGGAIAQYWTQQQHDQNLDVWCDELLNLAGDWIANNGCTPKQHTRMKTLCSRCSTTIADVMEAAHDIFDQAGA